MLHCNMNATSPLHLDLDDLLGELWHARRQDDLGRLALLAYCEVRRWARRAGESALAERSSELITHTPYLNRERFLAQVDALISELEAARTRLPQSQPEPMPIALQGAMPQGA